MRIIEITSLFNGAHRNQSWNQKEIPEGFALVPDELETQNFPFGDITVEEIDGVQTVISWTPLPIPEPKPIEQKASQLDVIEAQVAYTAMMTDTLLEV